MQFGCEWAELEFQPGDEANIVEQMLPLVEEEVKAIKDYLSKAGVDVANLPKVLESGLDIKAQIDSEQESIK